MTDERKIFTLTQLNISLEKHFIENFSNRDFWITAELIKVNVKSGHHYLELADSTDNQTTAQTRATIWASTYSTILSTIGLNEVRSILQPGNKLLLNVKIEYHKIYGLSLRVRDIDPNYSYGEIERKRKVVIKKLKAENLFDQQQTLRLPTIIKRIALIGSPGTSGFRDFLNELFNTHEFKQFAVKEFPVRVQGDAAIPDIVAAIKEANQYDAEVIVIIRGGGSKMDLALFDDYEISKAICLSKLPVITGIGHETDEVVADLVARQKFITPTAVAVHIHYAIQSFKEIMRELHDKMIRLSMVQLKDSQEEFVMYSNYLSLFSRELIHFWRNAFKDQEFSILEKSRTVLFHGKDELSLLSHKISSSLNQLVHVESKNLDHYLQRASMFGLDHVRREKEFVINQFFRSIQLQGQQLIDIERIVLKNQEELLTLLNPMKILSSGYTISTIDDHDIKDVEVLEGQEMKTLTTKYLITSKVMNIKENGNN